MMEVSIYMDASYPKLPLERARPSNPVNPVNRVKRKKV